LVTTPWNQKGFTRHALPAQTAKLVQVVVVVQVQAEMQ
jgi:hypothetical protein